MQHGAHGRMVDPGGLDAVENVAVADRLRINGYDAQPRVVGFVGLQAEPGGLEEGLPVVDDAIAELVRRVVDADLQTCVGTGEDRREREKQCQDIHKDWCFQANLVKFADTRKS